MLPSGIYSWRKVILIQANSVLLTLFWDEINLSKENFRRVNWKLLLIWQVVKINDQTVFWRQAKRLNSFTNLPLLSLLSLQSLSIRRLLKIFSRFEICLFNRDLNRGCLVYMFSLRFSRSKFLINLRRQSCVRKTFRTQVFVGSEVFSICV